VKRRLLQAVTGLASGLALAAHAAPTPETPAATRTAAPATIAGEAPRTPWRAPVSEPRQSVAGEAVRIEGKLYSPQALFILSRPEERWGRDAVVPHWLRFDTAPASLRSHLHPSPAAAASPGAAGAGAAGESGSPTNAETTAPRP
jgi:hypothetical protein